MGKKDKKIETPTFFQPTQQWDPGYPGAPGQIPGIAQQLTRGYGGSVADNMDYLGQMYKPMFADTNDPYVQPDPASQAQEGPLDDKLMKGRQSMLAQIRPQAGQGDWYNLQQDSINRAWDARERQELLKRAGLAYNPYSVNGR